MDCQQLFLFWSLAGPDVSIPGPLRALYPGHLVRRHTRYTELLEAGEEAAPGSEPLDLGHSWPLAGDGDTGEDRGAEVGGSVYPSSSLLTQCFSTLGALRSTWGGYFKD